MALISDKAAFRDIIRQLITNLTYISGFSSRGQYIEEVFAPKLLRGKRTVGTWISADCPDTIDDEVILGIAWIALSEGGKDLKWLEEFLLTTDLGSKELDSTLSLTLMFSKARISGSKIPATDIEKFADTLLGKHSIQKLTGSASSFSSFLKFSDGPTSSLQLMKDALGEISTLEIFAHGGMRYLQAVQELKLNIENVSVLLRKYDPASMKFPNNTEDQESYRDGLNHVKSTWESRKRRDFVKNLLILEHDFEPITSFMIANNRMVAFELYIPIVSGPGTESLSSWIATSETWEGEMIVNQYQAVFDALRELYTEKRNRP